MTYKVLYNDAVAMTGGQPVELHASPLGVVRQLLAEGVQPVRLLTDRPGRYANEVLPNGVTVHHRDELDNIQRELRNVKGVSGIVYEQTCAAELRRRRKRKLADDPDKRVFINPDVCEGCGDCSVQSNCISVQPLETEFGRKRKIDQSTCNKDISCVKGFCPSFVTVTGAKIAARAVGDAGRLDTLIAALPEPETAPLGDPGYNILVCGIGGTGVLTIGALLGMAAHLDGKGCTVLDMTGMAQKGGSVMSHVRIGRDPAGIYTSRLTEGMTDVLIACDMIVGSGPLALKTVKPGHTTAIINTDVAPTGQFQSNKRMEFGDEKMRAAIADALDGGAIFAFRARKIATDLTGDSIATNILMLGYAAQKGLMPVSVASLQQAIRLNGTFVEDNLRTFNLGRLIAQDAQAFAREIDDSAANIAPLATVDDVLASRTRLLTAYQNAAYAQTYRDFVEDVRNRVAARGLKDGERFVREVALTLARLMAYKDEYEVARLYTDPKFLKQIREQFAGDFTMTFHLAPPALPGNDDMRRPKKRAFGSGAMRLFKILAPMKALRGTPFDIFGYTADRRMERKLIADYRALIATILDRLDAANLPAVIALAQAAGDIAGYGPVKEASVKEYESRLPGLIGAFENPAAQSRAA